MPVACDNLSGKPTKEENSMDDITKQPYAK
nr:MAG TPA: hypothetical protein [Caudoviricetes sp.]